jgi:AcrR family transcriptional regulator
MNAKTPRRGAPRWGEPSARERLVKTVIELFYQEGVRAIGIDMVVEQSGVSKSSLYRTFASKNELIAAFAEEQNRRFWQWWDETVRRFDGAPRAQINALLAGVADQIGSPQFRGCPFINLATEFPSRQHPGTAIACGNKKEMRRRLRDLSREIGARDPRRLSEQLALLIDGAYGQGTTLGAAGLKRELIETARLLIDSHLIAK